LAPGVSLKKKKRLVSLILAFHSKGKSIFPFLKSLLKTRYLKSYSATISPLALGLASLAIYKTVIVKGTIEKDLGTKFLCSGSIAIYKVISAEDSN